MKYLQNLNQQQRDAIEIINGPLIIVAGPGSGKTRVLTNRIANLMANGISSYNILALTFTNKAAREMKERVVSLIGDAAYYIWMGTFHSILARLLRMECQKLGFQKNYSIYDETDSLKLIKRIMSDLHLPVQQYSPQSMRYRISQAKNSVITPDEFSRNAYDLTGEQTARVYREYNLRLKMSNAMDFDDLLLHPIYLLQSHKDILDKYQKRFSYILVDEYQDTNHAQYRLLKLLAGGDRNICVVGDDAQSIYAFRGADIRNILEFQKDYPDCRLVRLEQNYRSTKNILSAADSVIKCNQNQISKNLWTDNEEGDKITLLRCSDDRSEGQEIVKMIFSCADNLQVSYKDIAIMYRTNAQSRSLEEALRKRSIPYVIVGGVEFYQRKEIKDLLAYLRLLVNGNDNESFMRVINFPARGLGEIALRHLTLHASEINQPLLVAAGESDKISALSKRAQSMFLSFHDLVSKYRKLQNELSISELARSYTDEIGLLHHFKEEKTPESLARSENILELLSALSEYEAEHPEATLEIFLQEVSLLSDIDGWNDQNEAVTLMTLHSAKGLEFPVVFITGLEEGLLPYYNSTLGDVELEEERRLLYVGITRAMKKLFLSYANTRYRFSDLSNQSPSRFLSELPIGLLEIMDLKQDQRYFSRGLRRNEWKKEKNSADHYFDDIQPDYENQTDEGMKVRPGIMVQHGTFGRGKILHVVGKGDACKVIVNFEDAGSKTLMLKYAGLRIV